MFALRKHHDWEFDEIDDLYPFEKTLYVQQLEAFIKEENERARRAALEAR